LSGAELATRPRGHTPAAMQTDGGVHPLWETAQRVAASGLFAVKNPEQAFVLMLLCQEEGIPPIRAMRRYHIVDNRPVLRSDATQGDLMQAGWKVAPISRTATEAAATFSHPTKLPEGFTLAVTFEQFRAAGITNKNNWKNYPDDMLWARLVVKACRTLDPGILAGVLSESEAEDMGDIATPQAVNAQLASQAETALAIEQGPVYAGPEAGAIDRRDYKTIAADAIAKVAEELQGSSLSPPKLPELHAAIMTRAIMTGRYTGPKPQKVGQIVPILTELAKAEPAFVRGEITDFCSKRVEFGRPDPTPPPPPEPEAIDVEPAEHDALDSLYPAEEPPEPGWNG
jgi:hypothetical protein